MNLLYLEDDGYCFACGEKNQSGLKLFFRIEDARVFSEFIPQKHHQGFKGIVHGGIISAILDEAMVKAVLSKGISAVTAEITVRLKKPLVIGSRVFIDAEINKLGNRLIEASSHIKAFDKTIIAEARAKLLRNV